MIKTQSLYAWQKQEELFFHKAKRNADCRAGCGIIGLLLYLFMPVKGKIIKYKYLLVPHWNSVVGILRDVSSER
jgi:hypothetical protein